MPKFCPLASGSKGNCLYVQSDDTKLLIDVGLSLKQVTLRLLQIGVSIEEIDAVVISHEHHDHIQGLERFCKKHSASVYANADTAKALMGSMGEFPKFKIFATGEVFQINDIKIHPFSIQHDTVDPVAFTLDFSGVKIGVCTDLGFATTLVKARLVNCDYLYLESNHEPSMVHACSRSYHYKQRVLSRMGHLSNDACVDVLKSVKHERLKRVYLAHLSSECNSAELALKKAKSAVAEIGAKVCVALQDKVSEILEF